MQLHTWDNSFLCFSSCLDPYASQICSYLNRIMEVFRCQEIINVPVAEFHLIVAPFARDFTSTG